MRWLPGLHTFRHYQIAWLPHDVFAGLALAAVLVPVGIAYAVASGIPAICGLYATIFGLLAYALFGPSRVLVLGPDSSLVALVLGVVVPLSAGDPQRAIALAGMMAVVSGAVCVMAGVARLGFITELLSKPIRYGYMNGIALTVLIGQLPALFGVSVDGEGILGISRGFGEAILAGQTSWASLTLGAGTLVVLWMLRRSHRLPGVLIAVVGSTAVVAVFDLATRAGVSVLGALPRGLPAFAFPLVSGDIVPVLLGGVAVALVSFADTSVLSRSYAARTGWHLRPGVALVVHLGRAGAGRPRARGAVVLALERDAEALLLVGRRLLRGGRQRREGRTQRQDEGRGGNSGRDLLHESLQKKENGH